ncbi:MAG: cyclic nucleotide-binding domain-containing protein [Candidatus Riflebacteria bacterium]|nr:cyclic nucleotide-binding domain-containing protein [Candidatus Riflebacteria bacterium]
MLDKIDLFAGLTLRDLQDIERIAKHVTIPRGEIIFAQGDFARDLYIIEAGQIEISVKDYLQSKKPVTTLKNGDFFGEMALFDKNSTRSATARTLQNTNLIIIPGVEFERLLQEKPTISFKLLGALSRRLKETTNRSISATTSANSKEGRVITVASPRNGCGKTLFATTLVHLLSHEVAKKILFIDLDLYFAEGTFYMGVFSPKSICDLATHLTGSSEEHEVINKFLIRHTEHLYSLPGPNNFIEGERLTAAHVISIIKVCRSQFDYVVLDTESTMSDILLNSIDMSDFTFFLVDTHDLISLKSGVRYFQGLTRLNYSEDRMYILATRVADNFNAEKIRPLFKFKVLGGLPMIHDFTPQYGQTVYSNSPNGPYCSVVRLIVTTIFRETNLQKPAATNFLYRWFFDQEKPTTHLISNPEIIIEKNHSDETLFSEENLTVLLKYIRTNMIYGNLEEARLQIMKLLEFCQNSSLLFQHLGEIMTAEQQFSEAIDSFRRSLAIDPQNYMAMGMLAQITVDDELFNKATGILETKIKENPKYPDLHNSMGKLLSQKRDYDKSVAEFQIALSINPNYMEARINLAVALGEKQEYQKAIDELGKVESKNIRVYYMLGKFFHSMGKFFDALEAYRLASEINANYFDLPQKLNNLTDYFKRLETLINMHKQVLASHASYPDIHLKMGMLYNMVGQFKNAEDEFTEALRLNPQYELAQENLDRIKSRSTYAWTVPGRDSPLPGPNGVGITGSFTLDLLIEPESIQALSKHPSSLFLITLKNIRTSRQTEWKRNPADIATGSLRLDCSDVTPIDKNDILLVYLLDQSTGTMLSALPHWISESDATRCSTEISLSASFKTIVSNHPFYTPVHYFFVNFISQNLAGAIAGENPEYIALLTNARNKVVCKGRSNPEHADEINFVLKSTDGEDVVRAGDTLTLRITDTSDMEVFSMDFIVSQESIEAYSQTISMDSAVA